MLKLYMNETLVLVQSCDCQFQVMKYKCILAGM